VKILEGWGKEKEEVGKKKIRVGVIELDKE